MRNFVIGYGSLINQKSLERTLPCVEYIEPIYLKHYIRSWSSIENITPTYATTYLGVSKHKNSRINCIIFEVSDVLLPILDKREFLYTREKVSISDIDFFDNGFNINEKDSIWIYVTKKPKSPSKEFPIIQSYVDTCMEGCFEIEAKFSLEDFTIDFVRSTKNWSEFWVNDRIFPRAPHLHRPDAYRIDKILNDNVNEFFTKITIE